VRQPTEAGAVAPLTGFVVTATVLVVQMASGAFSARYMRLWYRDPVLKGVLALLTGTVTFAFWLLLAILTVRRPPALFHTITKSTGVRDLVARA